LGFPPTGAAFTPVSLSPAVSSKGAVSVSPSDVLSAAAQGSAGGHSGQRVQPQSADKTNNPISEIAFRIDN
jgi:hypothetical protein